MVFSDLIQVGLARSNDFDKTLQTSFKSSLVKQSKVKNNPISLSYFGSLNIRSKDYTDDRSFKDRNELVNRILISRKFSDRFSAQITPTFVHINRTSTNDHPHSLFATNLGVSMSVSKSTNFNIEYIYTLPTFDSDLYETSKNILSFGFDMETGGHVFQVNLDGLLVFLNCTKLSSCASTPMKFSFC